MRDLCFFFDETNFPRVFCDFCENSYRGKKSQDLCFFSMKRIFRALYALFAIYKNSYRGKNFQYRVRLKKIADCDCERSFSFLQLYFFLKYIIIKE